MKIYTASELSLNNKEELLRIIDKHRIRLIVHFIKCKEIRVLFPKVKVHEFVQHINMTSDTDYYQISLDKPYSLYSRGLIKISEFEAYLRKNKGLCDFKLEEHLVTECYETVENFGNILLLGISFQSSDEMKIITNIFLERLKESYVNLEEVIHIHGV